MTSTDIQPPHAEQSLSSCLRRLHLQDDHCPVQHAPTGVARICGAGTLRSSCPAAVQVMEQITEALYEQTMDAQEGVIYYLLDQMTEQHIKEVLVAYFILLSSGAVPVGAG